MQVPARHDLGATGWSLDDKRTSLLPEEKLGPNPQKKLTPEDHAESY